MRIRTRRRMRDRERMEKGLGRERRKIEGLKRALRNREEVYEKQRRYFRRARRWLEELFRVKLRQEREKLVAELRSSKEWFEGKRIRLQRERDDLEWDLSLKRRELEDWLNMSLESCRKEEEALDSLKKRQRKHQDMPGDVTEPKVSETEENVEISQQLPAS